MAQGQLQEDAEEPEKQLKSERFPGSAAMLRLTNALSILDLQRSRSRAPILNPNTTKMLCSAVDSGRTQLYCCVMEIPDFNTDGNLPEGVHFTVWEEFTARFAITNHRVRLASGLHDALTIFSLAGCTRVYVDGSYVTQRTAPKDYDVAWDPGGVDLPLLRDMEPVFFDFNNQRASQKAKFFGEFFPSSAKADSAGTRFLKFFQTDKNTGKPKGIIGLDVQEAVK